MSYLEVLSPCVTYNDKYRDWRTSVYDVDTEEGYDPENRAQAFTRMQELRDEGRLPLGLIFRSERSALETLALNQDFPPPALQDITKPDLSGICNDALQSFIK